jgi:hypothetical protein
MAEHVRVIGATNGGQIEIIRNEGWSVLSFKLDLILLFYTIPFDAFLILNKCPCRQCLMRPCIYR